ncbi:hypothetical protein C2S53_017953 [Perilla frutescens var. hirtella]|uniref:Uncharacterized protein n=1 Tax=Perilla frutescens var. hirtella TaxID=608512 RepID=A0AAD4J560_PERFH|nr:hypothetical protein C2S53_017953 [Perilla frutescens var. hirtella]
MCELMDGLIKDGVSEDDSGGNWRGEHEIQQSRKDKEAVQIGSDVSDSGLESENYNCEKQSDSDNEEEAFDSESKAIDIKIPIAPNVQIKDFRVAESKDAQLVFVHLKLVRGQFDKLIKQA